jgi:serine/threonine-protein kinase
MSPEQYSGGEIDARSDQFSAGVVLYEMLTGKCPFNGSSAAVMHQVLNDMPSAPSSRTADLPAELDAMVLKALAKRPDERYASAQSWRSDVLALLDTLTAGLDPDQTIVLAPLARQALAPPPPAADAGSVPVDWSPVLLAQLEQRLVSHVGPVASRLVRRAAAQATDSEMLAAQLARYLPDDAARHEFSTLLERHGAASGIESTRVARESSAARPAVPALDPERIESAARRLATFIGPIARMVAQRAAVGADTATFHARLVDALPASVDKDAFLNTLDDPAA